MMFFRFRSLLGTAIVVGATAVDVDQHTDTTCHGTEGSTMLQVASNGAAGAQLRRQSVDATPLHHKLHEIAKATDPTKAALLVEALANSAVKGEVVIDDETKNALTMMNQTLQDSLGIIVNATKVDQDLRDQHADMVSECITAYEGAKVKNAELLLKVEEKHEAHEDCRGSDGLSLDHKNMVSACDKLAVSISSLKPPCDVPDRGGMKDFWTNFKSFYDTNYVEWESNSKNCEDAEKKRAEKDAECDDLQREFEISFCSARQEMHGTCATRDMCHHLAKEEFHQVIAATLVAEAARKHIWKATMQISCYINDVLISAAETDAKQAALTACQGLDPDTAHLTLVEPKLPVQPPCDLAQVSVYPCTDAFVNSRYAGLMDVEPCQKCPPLPPRQPEDGFCKTIKDDGVDWSAGLPTYTVQGTMYHSYDKESQTVKKDITLLPGMNYKWSAVIDTYASVDREPMKFCAISDEFGEVCKEWTRDDDMRHATECDKGWTANPNPHFGVQVGVPGSSPDKKWIDCFKPWEMVITGPRAGGSVTLQMHMAIDQDRNDEGWGWHDMELEPLSCPSERTPFAMDAAKQIGCKKDMLAAGWSWTGCPVDHHGGSSLSNGIWCHSGAEMHLIVPPLEGSGTCTATWSNAYNKNNRQGFVRLMRNGVQLGAALNNQEQTVTFKYAPDDVLEFWEGFAIAKANADWIKCDTGAAAGVFSSVPVFLGNALVIDNKESMLAAGWTWTGCSKDHHGGGDLLNKGIWCHSEQEMHLMIPMSGGPATCKATFQNAYTHTGDNGFVRFMKNGQQLGEARAGKEVTVTFTYADGDEVELWEGFAIAKARADWLHCF